MSEESKNILGKLKELNKKKSVNIFLPSLGKKVKFLPFTLKQQKDILSKMPQDASGLITFNNLFNDIIIQNSEDAVKLEEINIFDRMSIVFSYRISSIGNNVDSEEGNVNLNEVIKNITNYDFSKIFKEIEISLKDISAVLTIPNLKYDAEINNQISKKLNKNSTTQTIISELYTSEVLKFIKSVTIEDVKVDLTTFNYFDRLEVVENLPGNFIKKIMKYIQDVKNVETDVTTVNGVKVDVSNDLFS
jgi:hypothetical protein